MEILRGRKPVSRILSRLGLIAILGVTCLKNAQGQVNEYQVKAAFLYSFASFVEWPPKTFNTPSDPLGICILGENPFGNALGDAVRGKAQGSRPFVVRVISELPPRATCQILFVDASGRRRFRSMVDNLKGEGVLTVGDAEGFIDDGGVINFKLEGGRIRFEISVEAAQQAQLSISSKLLSLAQLVRKQGTQR